MTAPLLHLAVPFVLAALGTCDPGPATSVHLAYHDRAPVFYSGHTTAELRRMAPSMTTVNLADFPVTSGVTEGKIGLETSLLFKSLEMEAGRYCLWPESLDVTLSYQAQVYIAREYKSTSCRYGQTKAHELRHVAADEETIREFLPEMRATADAAAGRLYVLGPFSLDGRENAKNRVLGNVKNALASELGKLERVRALRQQAIDTPAEYTRLSRACPGERIR